MRPHGSPTLPHLIEPLSLLPLPPIDNPNLHEPNKGITCLHPDHPPQTIPDPHVEVAPPIDLDAHRRGGGLAPQCDHQGRPRKKHWNGPRTDRKRRTTPRPSSRSPRYTTGNGDSPLGTGSVKWRLISHITPPVSE